MSSSVTKGTALAAADNLIADDVEGVKLVQHTMGLGVMVASTFQLGLLLLETAPKGKWGENKYDLRKPMSDLFDIEVEELIVKHHDAFSMDEVQFRTLISTIVLGSILPFLEGGDAYVAYPDYEEVTEWQMMGVFTVLAAAMVNAFNLIMDAVPVEARMSLDDVRRILIMEEIS